MYFQAGYLIEFSFNSFSVDHLGYSNKIITVPTNNANSFLFLINLKKNLTVLANLSKNNVLYRHHWFFPDLYRMFSFSC